jgi:hypothetical protein
MSPLLQIPHTVAFDQYKNINIETVKLSKWKPHETFKDSFWYRDS